MPHFDAVISKCGMTPKCDSWAGNYCKHHTVLLSQLPIVLRHFLGHRDLSCAVGRERGMVPVCPAVL